MPLSVIMISEDVLAVAGFAFYCLLMYIFIMKALQRYSGHGRKGSLVPRWLSSLCRSFTGYLRGESLRKD